MAWLKGTIFEIRAKGGRARFEMSPTPTPTPTSINDRWTIEQVRRAVVLAGLVFLLAFGAVALTKVDNRTATVWLANAVIVGMVIRAPRPQWFTLIAVAFLANLGANLANHDPLLRAALLAAVNMVESLIVLLLMGRKFNPTSLFDDAKVIARFLLYAGVVGPLVAAALAAGLLSLTGGAPFFATLVGWYLADALGLLTLGALLLAAQTRDEATPRGAWAVSGASVILSCAVTAIAFSSDAAPSLFMVAPVLMIVSLRAPLRATMVALVGSAAIAIATTAAGIGPIARSGVEMVAQIHLLQGFIASLLFVVLPVRALMGERARLGTVIARSERMFARIAEASPSGTIHFDRLGHPTYANHRWMQLTGLDETMLDEDRWLDAVAPADRSAARSQWARARATLEPSTSEFRFARSGEPAGFAELNLYPEVEHGQVLGFVARLTDVTGRRLAEDALHEREERHRLVTENVQDVILCLGLDGRPRYVSGAALRVTGYAPVELIGRPLSDLIHCDDAAILSCNLARLADGQTDPSIEFRLRHRDGHYSWFESSHRVLFDRDGHPIELIASLRDIELRRRSEATAAVATAQLRETNRLLLLAEELAGVGHWHFDPAANELDYSPQINRMLKQKRADRLRVEQFLEIVQADDRRVLLACLAQARRLPGSAECAIRVHAREGLRHVRLVAQAEYHGAQFGGWFGVVGDVTDQLIADTALIEARDAAQAAAVAKSQFLATMSHEIRTPMTGVLGMIDLLRDDPQPAEREHFFATLKQSADVLMAVLDDVLDFSKIDSGALQLETSEFDLAAVTTATVDLFRNAASGKGLVMAFEVASDARRRVRGDAVRLQQVLSNLLSNAIKFTADGQIRLRISATPAGEGRSHYQFEVSDSGLGLDPGQMQSLFEPFVQADASTSRRFGGTGLGLAISRRLVHAMGGEIRVSSRLGEGSTFTFDLPLADGVAARAEPHPATTQFPTDQFAPAQLTTARLPTAQALDILVAEDNRVNQMLIAALVGRMGHRATVVENGREAVEAAAATAYDVILMDMQMPEMDGLAATRTIRASGGPCAATTIIALTADASAERRRFYDGAGLSEFLTKPIDRQALAARLARVTPRCAPLDPAAARVSADVSADGEADGGTAHEPVALFDELRIADLRAALGTARFDALLALLIIECRERPAQFEVARQRGDLAAIHTEGHSLRGAANSIGAMALAAAAQKLEMVTNPTLAGPLIDTLAKCAAATRGAVERMLAAAPGQMDHPFDLPSGDRASA